MIVTSIGRYHNEQAIRVLIADDHAIFRQGLATIINRDPDMQVIPAENGERRRTSTGCHADGSANARSGGLLPSVQFVRLNLLELLY